MLHQVLQFKCRLKKKREGSEKVCNSNARLMKLGVIPRCFCHRLKCSTRVKVIFFDFEIRYLYHSLQDIFQGSVLATTSFPLLCIKKKKLGVIATRKEHILVTIIESIKLHSFYGSSL